MRIDQVPQDDENFYDGHQRAMYAKKLDGAYVQAPSKGWAVETYFTALALSEISEETQRVYEQVKQGNLSPLAFHMTFRQMTPALLALHVGMFQFQVKRHLKPQVFAKLSPLKLKRYADALNLTVEALKQLPEPTAG